MNKTEKEIVQIISDHFRVEVANVLSRSRERDYAEARQWIITIFRLKFDLGYMHMGRLLNRDHATCIHAVKKMTGFMDVDPNSVVLYHTLLAKINHLLPVKQEVIDNKCPMCGSPHIVENKDHSSVMI